MRPSAAAWLAVLAGGALGTAARLGIDALLPHADDAFPFSTLLANTMGALLLGVLTARVWPVAPAWLKAGLGAGLLGSFTTFSAVAVSLVSLAAAGAPGTAALYLAATLVVGFAAAWAGLRLGRLRRTEAAA